MTTPDLTIIGIEEEMAQAFNQSDVDSILAYFAPDFSGFSSTTHERIHGVEALRNTFDYYLREGHNVEFEVSNINVKSFEEFAIATFHWSVIIDHQDHKHQIPGRGTHVFQLIDRQWKIIHEHFSRAQHQE